MDSKEKMMEKPKQKIIYSLKLAGYLMFNGCRLIKAVPNERNPKFNVYFFYDDEKVDAYLKKYHEEITTNDEKAVHNRKDRTTVQGMAKRRDNH